MIFRYLIRPIMQLWKQASYPLLDASYKPRLIYLLGVAILAAFAIFVFVFQVQTGFSCLVPIILMIVLGFLAYLGLNFIGQTEWQIYRRQVQKKPDNKRN